MVKVLLADTRLCIKKRSTSRARLKHLARLTKRSRRCAKGQQVRCPSRLSRTPRLRAFAFSRLLSVKLLWISSALRREAECACRYVAYLLALSLQLLVCAPRSFTRSNLISALTSGALADTVCLGALADTVCLSAPPNLIFSPSFALSF